MFTKPRGLILLGILFVMIGAAHADRPDRNAFINRKVASTAELISQVQRDREVRDRYLRHFAMGEVEMVAYLRSLHPTTLVKDGVYRIYSAPDGGVLKAHTEKLKKGLAVFASSDGTPVLILKCGNPLTLGPNTGMDLNALIPAFADHPADVRTVPIDLLAADVSPSVVALTEPGLPELLPTPTPPVTSTGTENIPLVSSSSGLLPILAGLGGITLIPRGGHSRPVPEPGSMLVFGVGLAGLALRVHRSRKR